MRNSCFGYTAALNFEYLMLTLVLPQYTSFLKCLCFFYCYLIVNELLLVQIKAHSVNLL